MAVIPADENEFPKVLLTEGAAPAAPAAGLVEMYAKSDGLLYQKDGAGVETLLAGATIADILDLPTAETDDTLVLAPDGAGGVEFRAETGGSPAAGFSGARVYHNTTQSVGASITVLSMNSEDFDTNSYHDNSTNNSRLTLPYDGYYQAVGHVQFSGSAVGICGLLLNGSDIRGSAVSANNASLKAVTTQIIQATAGQYIELWAYQSGGAANTGDTTEVENMNSLAVTFLGTLDGGGIPATIVDAKGDLIAATAADTVARLAVGTNNLALVAASGETTGLKWAHPVLTTATGSLGADVTMTNANQFYDGPSVSLAAGTWLVTGRIAIAGTAITQQHAGRITDGTNHYAECEWSDQGAGTGYVQSASLQAVITLGSTTTIKLQAAAIRTGCTMKRGNTVNSSSTNTTTHIVAVRVA